eukprot:PhF_6_TR19533/c0_g1_i1/m.28505/K08494/NSPN; novel plant SNARE
MSTDFAELDTLLFDVHRRLEKYFSVVDKQREVNLIQGALEKLESRIKFFRSHPPKKSADLKIWEERLLFFENATKLTTERFRVMASRTLVATKDDKGNTTDVHIMDNYSISGGQDEPTFIDPSVARAQLIRRQMDVTEETLKSILASQGIVARTELVAIETENQLAAQGNVVDGISKVIEGMESTLQRASKEVNYFSRQLAKDKMFSVIFVLVICFAIVIIVLRIKAAVEGSSTSPAPPVNTTMPN